jgi:nucleotide-binding universal stress UspA family protein
LLARAPVVARLLLPLDGSPAALRAAELVAGYRGAREQLAPILVNVQSRPVRVWPGSGFDSEAADAALRARGERALEPARRLLRGAGFEPPVVLRLGYAPDEIMDEARQRNVAAIVMGTRGEGLLGGFAIGSVALRVAHGSEYPVMLVKPDARLPKELGRRARLLVPADASGNAVRAAQEIVRCSAWLGEVRADVVHVQEPLTLLEAILPPHRDALEQWSAREAQEALAGARDALRAAGIESEGRIVAGNPAPRLAQLIEETGVDLVMMTTRGLGAGHHALAGSMALKLAHLSRVPVMLVS